MNRLFNGLGTFVVRYRVFVVLGWIVVAIVASRALPSLGSEVNNNNVRFLPASAPSSRASTLAVPVLGGTSSDTQVFVVASRPGTALTSADEAVIGHLAAKEAKVADVLSARPVATSSDGKVTQVLIETDVSPQDEQRLQTVVDAVGATLASARAPDGLQFHLAGEAATSVANATSSNRTGGSLESFSLLFIVILLIVIFRSLLAPVLTLLPAVFALVVSIRFVGGLGAHGLKISEITELLLIVLLLGAGTDYGLFLVFRVREEIRRGLAPKEAVVFSLVRVGESISASAGTVILALLTLLIATFGIYNSLAVPLAVGMGVMLIAGLTLLPALLAIFGRAAFWPSKVVAGEIKPGLWGSLAVRLVRRPGVTLVVGLLVFASLAAFALNYRSGGFGGATNAPAGSSAAIGNELVAAHFPHSSANPANLVFRFGVPAWQDPGEVVAAERSLSASGQLGAITGPLDANGSSLSPARYSQLHAELGNPDGLPAIEPPGVRVPSAAYESYRATATFVSATGTTIQFEASFSAGSQQSTAALQAVPQVRAAVSEAARAAGATASGLAGEAAGLYDVSSASDHDLLRVFPFAILAIGVLLALVLRSLVAPLYLIVSVALSFLAALGVSTLVFIDLGGTGGLTFILPFLMFIFLLALGEDYNILVMTRIREEARELPLREAVARAVGRTGPTVTSAGVVLAGTFGVLAVVGGGGQVTDIGAGLAIGILMDTFLVRTLLVPSVVVLLGRHNWWPSKMSRQA